MFGRRRRRREAAQTQAAISAQGAAAERARVMATEFAQDESVRVQAAEALRLAEMKRGNDLLEAAGNVSPEAQVKDDRDKSPLKKRRGLFNLSSTRGRGKRGLLGLLGASGLGNAIRERFSGLGGQ